VPGSTIPKQTAEQLVADQRAKMEQQDFGAMHSELSILLSKKSTLGRLHNMEEAIKAFQKRRNEKSRDLNARISEDGRIVKVNYLAFKEANTLRSKDKELLISFMAERMAKGKASK
jgi:hypothetical protein